MQISASDFPNFLCDKQEATTTGRLATINNQKSARIEPTTKLFLSRFFVMTRVDLALITLFNLQERTKEATFRST